MVSGLKIFLRSERIQNDQWGQVFNMLSFISGTFYFFIIENHRQKDGKLSKQVQKLKCPKKGSRCEKRGLGAVSCESSHAVGSIISRAHFIVWSAWWSSCFDIMCLPLQSHPSAGTVPQGHHLSNACVNQNGKPRLLLSLLGSTNWVQNDKEKAWAINILPPPTWGHFYTVNNLHAEFGRF